MKKAFFSSILFVLVLFSAIAVYFWYPYIFAVQVEGQVAGVKQLMESMAIITESAAAPSNKVFSYAIGIRDLKTGEIVTGSSEDRQWGVVKEGQCARARFYPYPPWHLEKSGTYYGVRLIRLYDNCDLLTSK